MLLETLLKVLASLLLFMFLMGIGGAELILRQLERSERSRMRHLRSSPAAQSDVQLEINHAIFRFMDLPTEIRLQIYRHLLARHRSEDPWENSRLPISTVYACRVHLSISDIWYAKWEFASLLLVSRKVNEEAVSVLYSDNALELVMLIPVNAHHDERVNDGAMMFQIGTLNVSCMRWAAFDIPGPCSFLSRACYVNPEASGLVKMICQTLTGLQNLRLRTSGHARICCDYRASELWKHHQRAIIYLAATIVEQHPVLNKAIWNRTNGGKVNDRHCRLDAGHGFRCVCLEVDFCVDLLRDNAEVDHLGWEGPILQESQHPVGAFREVILDCDKIRTTAWAELFDTNIDDFAVVGAER